MTADGAVGSLKSHTEEKERDRGEHGMEDQHLGSRSGDSEWPWPGGYTSRMTPLIPGLRLWYPWVTLDLGRVTNIVRCTVTRLGLYLGSDVGNDSHQYRCNLKVSKHRTSIMVPLVRLHSYPVPSWEVLLAFQVQNLNTHRTAPKIIHPIQRISALYPLKRRQVLLDPTLFILRRSFLWDHITIWNLYCGFH
jgi:hypothetical protein